MASNPPDGSDNIPSAEPPKPGRTRLVIALTLLAFVGGLAAMAWVMVHWGGGLGFGDEASGPPAAAAPGAAQTGVAPSDPAIDITAAMRAIRSPREVLTADQQSARVLDLEQRLARITIAAQAASGYANRAEAMMVAFAARRALDAGKPLGYVEGQLRLLFGDAQPRAVATIVNAAEEPVTLPALRAGLEAIGGAVERGSPGESWWAVTMRELRGLAVIRHAEEPSPQPRQRIERARLNVESGQMEAAIMEIEALPAQPEMARWLEQARRYNEAHRALDVIEAAAILEPRAAPMVAPTSQPPAQTPAPSTTPAPTQSPD